MMNRAVLLLMMSTLILVGCGNQKNKSINIEVVAIGEGPFFEGSNSLISEVELNLSELVGDSELKEITHVTINEISIELDDHEELTFNHFNSAAIQLVSDNSPMTSIAIMNPIKLSGEELKMTTSEQAEVTSFFQEGKFSLLLDLDFKEDSYSELLNAEIEINLTLEYK